MYEIFVNATNICYIHRYDSTGNGITFIAIEKIWKLLTLVVKHRVLCSFLRISSRFSALVSFFIPFTIVAITRRDSLPRTNPRDRHCCFYKPTLTRRINSPRWRDSHHVTRPRHQFSGKAKTVKCVAVTFYESITDRSIKFASISIPVIIDR